MSWWLGTYSTNVKQLAGSNYEKEITQPNQTAAYPWTYQTQTARNKEKTLKAGRGGAVPHREERDTHPADFQGRGRGVGKCGRRTPAKCRFCIQ